MSLVHFQKISEEIKLPVGQIKATATLLEEGATIPFIARYRKELTGNMDEVVIGTINDRLQQLKELDHRRDFIIKSIEEQGKLTSSLKSLLEKAEQLSTLEDLYLPYKPKRKTRASMARERGLEPLAEKLKKKEAFNLEKEAEKYIDAEKKLPTTKEVLAGARDIIAEAINEDATIRKKLRENFAINGMVSASIIKGKETVGEKFKDYFAWEEPLKSIPSHRMLAIRRGEKEMILSMGISPPEETSIAIINAIVNPTPIKNLAIAEQYELIIKDAYKRLLKPSVETDARLEAKQKADTEAVQVFADNLKALLLSPALGQKAILAIDPGFRTGCKIVALDKQGKLLDHDTIFPVPPKSDTITAAAKIKHFIAEYNVEAIAIGNGTASRETETFVKSIGLDPKIIIVVVNESGASIYSASAVAREEFPDKDVTVRGTISIGRRLADPLAELVKLDPKSIGVGQYQHDVDQHLLKKSLDETVSSCVNAVGVEVNTASKELLTYVAGLGPSIAQNIVNYRNKNGAFKNRKALLKVERLGEKAFEQAAGFLRISDSKNILDRSAVHPERYALIEKMAKDINSSVDQLVKDATTRKKISLKNYISDNVGMPTLSDIMEELAKPGRDPREQFEAFAFDNSINQIEDVKIGMKVPGIVTNLTKFGAFVDIGVHQDGLIHVSHMADRFVDNPTKILKVQQQVNVTVVELDISRKRIGLSLKKDPFGKVSSAKKQDNKQHQKRKNNQNQKINKGQQKSNNMEDALAALKGKWSS